MYVVVVGEEGVEGVLVGGVVGVDAIAMARTAEKQTRTAKNFMLIGFFWAFRIAGWLLLIDGRAAEL